MGKKEYSVSEAVRLIGVESHVLRYWEDELGIEIQRSAQGHRLYSEANIRLFRQVRELKAKGLQLKAIRLLIDSQGQLMFGENTPDIGFAEQLMGLTRVGGSSAEPDGPNGSVRDADCEECERISSEDKSDHRITNAPDGTEKRPVRTEDELGGAVDRSGRTEDEPGSVMDRSERSADEIKHMEDGPETLCGEIVPVGEPEPMRQFERILRHLIEEVVSEQNGKLEEAITRRMREELDDFCLQYEQILREAAVSLEAESRGSGRLRRFLRRLFG